MKVLLLLIDAVVNQGVVPLANHFAHLVVVHAAVTRNHKDPYQLSLSPLLSCMPSLTVLAVQRAVDFYTSGWLNVLPLIHHHFDLSAQQFQFHDALCLHYHCPSILDVYIL